MLWLLLLVLWLLTIAPAYADRDIVYVARYYAPPGSHWTSHFHLYRINPDGTGETQLTFGVADEDNPQWSPDGSWIAFTRQFKGNRDALCLIHVSGGAVRVWRGPDKGPCAGDYSCQWSPDSKMLAVIHSTCVGSTVSLMNLLTGLPLRRFVGASDFLWSPDGKHGYVHFDKSDRIFDLVGGRQSVALTAVEKGSFVWNDVVWSNSQTLIRIVGKNDGSQVYLSALGLNGKEIRRVPCRWGNETQDPYRDSIDPWGKSLLSLPYTGHTVVYVQDEGNSSTRPDNVYYFADTVTGKMTQLTTGQFLSCSSDRTHFCTAEARSLANYGKPLHGYQKSVYVASLDVGQKSGKEKSITPGLVWVTGADWRKGK